MKWSSYWAWMVCPWTTSSCEILTKMQHWTNAGQLNFRSGKCSVCTGSRQSRELMNPKPKQGNHFEAAIQLKPIWVKLLVRKTSALPWRENIDIVEYSYLNLTSAGQRVKEQPTVSLAEWLRRWTWNPMGLPAQVRTLQLTLIFSNLPFVP